MQLVDTHCHIQFPDYGLDPDQAIAEAKADGVTKLLCVGTDLKDSQRAIEFVQQRDTCWATIGLHPHEASAYADNQSNLAAFAKLVTAAKVVAIGECGLDYYYEHSPKEAQKAVLRFQLDLAKKHNLPCIWHVREAFDDFFTIVDEYPGVTGVIHSFTYSKKELELCLKRGYYIGLNGIMTFTKRADQLAAAKAVPLQKLVLETDAPFLTPVPFRGIICQPKHVRVTAEFLAKLRGENLPELADATTQNALALFNLK